jgi:hypothetical protein
LLERHQWVLVRNHASHLSRLLNLAYVLAESMGHLVLHLISCNHASIRADPLRFHFGVVLLCLELQLSNRIMHFLRVERS